MHGISSQSKEKIDRIVGDLFDRMSLRLLGDVPSLRHKRHTLVGFEPSIGLAALFIQSMNNKYLNHVESDVLKGILMGSLAYISTLKAKTSNVIAQKMDGLAREAQMSGEKIPEQEISKAISEELDKAKSHLETIAMSEGTKTRNLGSAMEITRSAASVGEDDPSVFFNVIKDNSTCEVCIDLYLMPDKITPRVYKMSELSAGYYKKGGQPSILGSHPRCRCTPSHIPSGWGFNGAGHISFIRIGHSEYDKQNKAA